MEHFSYKIEHSWKVDENQSEKKVEFVETLEEMESRVGKLVSEGKKEDPWSIFVYSIDHHGHGMATVQMVDYFINKGVK